MQFNVMEMLRLIKAGKDPEQMILYFLDNQGKSSPVMANLSRLARENKTDEIEQFARNICAQRGLDYETELAKFKTLLGGK